MILYNLKNKNLENIYNYERRSKKNHKIKNRQY